MIAVAECPEDLLRDAALEKLRALAVHDVARLHRRDGLKTLVHSIVPKVEGEMPVAATLSIPIVHTFSHLLSAPGTRAFLKPSDLQVSGTRCLAYRHPYVFAHAVKRYESQHVCLNDQSPNPPPATHCLAPFRRARRSSRL